MRVVFDSNIYISALSLPGGRADKAIRRILDGIDTLLISKPILDEVLSILASKFSRDAEALSQVAVTLGELAEMVRPVHRLKVLADDPDNRILECAKEAARVRLSLVIRPCLISNGIRRFESSRYVNIYLEIAECEDDWMVKGKRHSNSSDYEQWHRVGRALIS